MSQIKKQLSRQAGSIEDAWHRPVGPKPPQSAPMRIRKARLELVQLQPADKMRLEAARGLDLLADRQQGTHGKLPEIHEYNHAINMGKLTGSLIHQRIAIIAN